MALHGSWKYLWLPLGPLGYVLAVRSVDKILEDSERNVMLLRSQMYSYKTL
jgi:hypothetical protein